MTKCKGQKQLASQSLTPFAMCGFLQEPPEKIKEVKHRAVFYRVKTETRYTFRSSLFPSKFLGFELFNDALKLVLHTMEHDEMDERCTFSLHDK